MPIKGEGRNRGKWKIGVEERLIQGRDRMIRGAQLKAGKTLREIPLQLLYPLEITCNRSERKRGETLRADAREFQPRVWLFVARSFTTSMQRASTCEFCQMRDVDKTSPKMSGCRGNSLRVLAQVGDYDTLLIINFYLKLRFSKWLGCFLGIFFLGQVKCFNSV